MVRQIGGVMTKKKVWAFNQLWDIVNVLRPNKYDTYILVQRFDNTVHEGGVRHVEMNIIDVGNDIFVFDSPQVQKLMNMKKSHETKLKQFDEHITEIWLQDIRELDKLAKKN
jgi:hypothetical protein